MVAEYRRRVANWLESRGATDIVWGNGGKRCRLSFRLNGVDRTFPVVRTPGDSDVHKVIIGQLNRDLGRPPERGTLLRSVPAPFSERIVSMGLAERQGDLLVYSDFKEMEERTMSQTTQTGHAALYVANDKAKRRLRFRWPMSISEGLPSRMLQLEKLGDWHWAIRAGGTPATELRPGNVEDTDMIEFMVPAEDYEPNEFGSTACEFMVVDGTVMATVDPTKLASVRETKPYTRGGRNKSALSEDEVRQRVADIKRLTQEVYEGSSVRMEVEGTALTLDCIHWVRPREEW